MRASVLSAIQIWRTGGQCSKRDSHEYILGESGWIIYEHAGEHWTDRQNWSEGSYLVKHWSECHGDLQEHPTFKFKVVLSFKDALTRQVSEAVRIDLRGGWVLNRTREYSHYEITKLTKYQEEWKNTKRTERNYWSMDWNKQQWEGWKQLPSGSSGERKDSIDLGYIKCSVRWKEVNHEWKKIETPSKMFSWNCNAPTLSRPDNPLEQQ